MARLASAVPFQSLKVAPPTVQTLTLSGIQVEDQEALVEAVTRLTGLRELGLCGVSAVCDETLEKVILYKYDIPAGLLTWLSTPSEHCHPRA